MMRLALTSLMASLLTLNAFAAASLQVTSGPQAADRKLAVVVHPNNPISTIHLRTLRRLLFGEELYLFKRNRATIALQATGDRQFEARLKYLLTVPRPEYRRQMMLLEYQGQEPVDLKVLPTAEDVRKFVSSNPNSIGILETEVQAPGRSVRELRILLNAQPQPAADEETSR